MCKYLDPAAFMVFVFANASEDVQSLSFRDLRKIRDQVSSSLEDQNVFIEWTRNSVLSAVECFHDVFKRKDAKVVWHGSDKNYARESFSVDFPEEFGEKLDHAIKDALESVLTERV